MRRNLKRLREDEAGATAVEYALILAAIASVILVIVFALGTKVKGQYSNMNSSMP
jgi:pilus assembly protein Flp/PilA